MRKFYIFLTLKNSQKTVEFEQNNKVAFTTIPIDGLKHIKAKGIIRKSQKFCSRFKKQIYRKNTRSKKEY